MEILNKLPNELADIVRQYRGINTIAYAAIREYYNSLFKKKNYMKNLFGLIMYIQLCI